MTDPNIDQRIALVQSLHKSETELVLALAGGGSLVLSDLLTVPGGSKTLLEATVPYSEESLRDYIGRRPDLYCSQRTARYLAMTAFRRALDNIDEGITSRETDLEDFVHLIGVGCTASLVTDREKKGEYRVHVATQTLRRTTILSLRLTKHARTRWEEERLVADLILNAIESARQEQTAQSDPASLSPDASTDNGIARPGEIGWKTFGQGTTEDYCLRETLPLSLRPGERILGRQTVGSPPLVDLFFGKSWAVLWQDGEIRHYRLRKELPTPQPVLYNPQAEYMQAIFPGSFNPIHQGHLEMIDIAEHRLGNRVALEISVQNADKPLLDYIELENRLQNIAHRRPEQFVWLTQTPLFSEKARLFKGATFVVGADTLRRFAELRFYHENTHKLHDVLRLIGFYNCRFLVFARDSGGDIEALHSLDVPDMLRSLSDEVPDTEFAMNISSRDLRRHEF